MRHRLALPTAGALLLFASAAPAVSDYQFTLGESGMSDYTLDAVSSTDVYAGTLGSGTLDPTINLIVGKRYNINNTAAGGHPLDIIAKGANSSQDTVLLSQFSTGTLESDAGINWVEVDTEHCEFTVTQTLVTAMRAGGKVPGYHCEVHPDDMRGNFTIFGSGTVITDPIAAIQRGSLTIALQPIATGLTAPLGVVDPDDASGRLFIYDQTGKIFILQGGSILPTPLLDLSARLVTLSSAYDERGLLGVALSPNFTTDRKLYTYTSEPIASGVADFTITMTGTPNCHEVVAEWTVQSGNPNVVDTGSRREMLRFEHPQSNHNGGEMAFGPDGNLYIAVGDGGQSDDLADGHSPRGNGQDINVLLGKLLRINPSGTNSANGKYGIPATNPFVGSAGLDEIYAMGFRNPFRFCFSGSTLIVPDVGQNKVEEINTVVLGGNYGWPIKEGSYFFDNNGAGSGRIVTEAMYPYTAALVEPIADYDHDDGICIIGGYIYNAGDVPGLDGHYVFGDFSTSFSSPLGRLFYLETAGVGVPNTIREFHTPADAPLGQFLKGMGTDADGNIYYCVSTTLGPSGTNGQVLKLINGTASARHWTLY